MVRIISDSWIYVYISTFVTILYLVGFFLNSTNFQLHHNTLSNNASTDHLFKFQTKAKFVKISIHVTINTKLTAFCIQKVCCMLHIPSPPQELLFFLKLPRSKLENTKSAMPAYSSDQKWQLIFNNCKWYYVKIDKYLNRIMRN